MNIIMDKNTIIIFKKYSDILERYELRDGSIINAYDNKYVVCYLSGYTSRTIEITKDKLVAIVDNSKNEHNYCHLGIGNGDIEFLGYFIKVNKGDNLILNND